MNLTKGGYVLRPNFFIYERPAFSTSVTDYVLGVDLGGTNILIIAASPEGAIIAKGKCSTPKRNNVLVMKDLTRTIWGFVEDVGLQPSGLKSVAIGIPGVVDMDEGNVSFAPNLGWVEKHSVMGPLSTAFPVPVVLENDVNMAVIGEKAFGDGKGVENMIFVAVGTGIGAGIIINDRLYRGAHGSAGEIGFMALDNSCLRETYHEHGYLEMVASGRGIADRARRNSIKADTKNVFAAASGGDPVAKAVVKEALDALCLALVNIIAVMDPELIVLGGGVLKDKEIADEIQNRVRRLIPCESTIVLSMLGVEAQAYGATAVALDLIGKKQEDQTALTADRRKS